MGTRTTQLRVDYKGRTYGGIFSVSGNTMIARIPGIDSRARPVDGRVEGDLAREIFDAILADAERAGKLR